MMEPLKFDGKGSFETFWAQFQNWVTHNRWNRAQELVYLKNSLDKSAANILWDYNKDITCLLYTSPSPRD